MKSFICLLAVLILFAACGFDKKIETTELALSVPKTVAGQSVSEISSIGAAATGSGSDIKQSIAASTSSEDEKEIVFFMAAIAGENYAGVQTLSEDYFRANQALIESTKTVDVNFDSVPMGVDLVANVTLGMVSNTGDPAYPLGSFQFFSAETGFNLQPGQSTSVNLTPAPQEILPLVRYAGFVGYLENCTSGINCDFVPYANKSMDISFCDPFFQMLEDQTGGEEGTDSSSSSDDSSTSTSNTVSQGGEGTSTLGESVDGPGEFFACQDCSDDGVDDDHMRVDYMGRLSTEMFINKAVKYYLIDDSNQRIEFNDCTYTPTTDATHPYVFDRNFIVDENGVAQIMDMATFISKLNPTQKSILLPGYASSYNTNTNDDVDADGVPDKLELEQFYTSPFQTDDRYSYDHNEETSLWMYEENVDFTSGIEVGIQIDYSSLPYDQLTNFAQCFDLYVLGAGATNFSASTASRIFDTNDSMFKITSNSVSGGNAYLVKAVFNSTQKYTSGNACANFNSTDQSTCQSTGHDYCVWIESDSTCNDPCSGFYTEDKTGYVHVYVASNGTSHSPTVTTAWNPIASQPVLFEPIEDLSGSQNVITQKCHAYSTDSTCNGDSDCAWLSELEECVTTSLYSAGWNLAPGMYRMIAKADSNPFYEWVSFYFDGSSPSWDWQFIHSWDKRVRFISATASYLDAKIFVGPWYYEALNGMDITYRNAINDTGATSSDVFNVTVYPEPFLSHMDPQMIGDNEYLMLYSMGDASSVGSISMGTNYGTLTFSKADTDFTGHYGEDSVCGSFPSYYEVKFVKFFDSSNGIAVVNMTSGTNTGKDVLYKTVNGGLTWINVHVFSATRFIEDVEALSSTEVWLLAWENAMPYEIYFYDGSTVSSNILSPNTGANIWDMKVVRNGTGYYMFYLQYADTLIHHAMATGSSTIAHTSPTGSIPFSSATPTALLGNLKTLDVKLNPNNNEYCAVIGTENNSGNGLAIIGSHVGSGARDITVAATPWTIQNSFTNSEAGVDNFNKVKIVTCDNSTVTAYAAGNKNMLYYYNGSAWVDATGCSGGDGSGNVFDCGSSSLSIVNLEVFDSGDVLAAAEKDCTIETCSAGNEWDCWSTCCSWDFTSTSCYKKDDYVTKTAFSYDGSWYHLDEFPDQVNDLQIDPGNTNNYYLATKEALNKWTWDGKTQCNNVSLYHLGEVGYEQLPKTFWGEGEGRFISNGALNCGTYQVSSLSYYDSGSSLIKTVTPSYSGNFEQEALARNSSFTTCQYSNYGGTGEPAFSASSVSISSIGWGKYRATWPTPTNCDVIDNYGVYIYQDNSGYAGSVNDFMMLKPQAWAPWQRGDSSTPRGCYTYMDFDVDPNNTYYSFIVRAHYWGTNDGNVIIHNKANSGLSNILIYEDFENLSTSYGYTDSGNQKWPWDEQWGTYPTVVTGTYIETYATAAGLREIFPAEITSGTVTIQADVNFAGFTSNTSTGMLKLECADSTGSYSFRVSVSTGPAVSQDHFKIYRYVSPDGTPSDTKTTSYGSASTGTWYTIKAVIDLDGKTLTGYYGPQGTPTTVIDVPSTWTATGATIDRCYVMFDNDMGTKVDNIYATK